MFIKKYISGFIVLLFFISMSGCLITHRSHTYERTEISASDSEYNSRTFKRPSASPISKEDLKQIEPGITTKNWVLEKFGPPTEVKKYKENTEVLVYERCVRTVQEFSIFLVFSTNSSEDKREVLSIEVEKGIVQKYWLD